MILKPHKFSAGIFEHLSIEEKINFTRHLSIVIKAGIPLFEGLKIIQKQARKRTLRRVIDQLIIDVNNGQFLSDAMERHRHLFGEFFINIIRIGEASGTLATNLLYLAEELKKSKILKSRVRSAMIYPIVLLAATIGITGLLVFFVFPKVLPIFESLNVKLPLATRILIGVANFLINHGVTLFAALAIFYIVFRLLLKIEGFRYIFHRMIFLVPVFSRLSVDINMANMTRVLQVLMKSGVKIVEAVTITSKTFSNLVYRRALLRAADWIRKGEQFAEFLGSKSGKKFFPPLLTSLVEIGENTGNLEDNLQYLTEYYGDEIETSLRNLTALLEPVLLLLMGLIVGFVALSIILPIYSVTQGIK